MKIMHVTNFRTLILLWSSHFFLDFFLGIWPMYKTLAKIDIAKAGFIMGMAGFAGEILQLLFGFLCDLGFKRRVLLFGLCMGSFVLFITFTSNLAIISFFMLCLFIGSGSFHPAAVGIASQLFPKKGRSILFFSSGGALGMGISQIAFTKSLDLFHGHAYPLFLPVIALSLIWFFYPMEEKVHREKRFSLKELVHPFIHHKKQLILLYIAQVTSYGVFLTFIFLLPDILQMKQVDAWLFKGGGHMCFIFGSVLGMIGMSFLCDYYSYKNLLISVIICSFIFLFLFLFSPISNTIYLIILLACLGIPLYMMNPLITAWGNQIIPESPSTVSALLMGFAWCISLFFPFFAGYFVVNISVQPFTVVMACISLLLIISLLCVMRISKAPVVFSPQETS